MNQQATSRSAATNEKTAWGTTGDGRAVEHYTMRNAAGITVSFMSYGGIITRIEAPDRYGNLADITLGFPSLAGYEKARAPYFGALIGRYANRIGGARLDAPPRRVRACVTLSA